MNTRGSLVRSDLIRRCLMGCGVVALLVVGQAPAAVAQNAGCRIAGGRSVDRLAVNPAGDLETPGGETWTPAGIVVADPSKPGLADAQRSLLAAFAASGPFRISAVAGRPDRWGRMPALIGREGSGDHLAAALARAGLAVAKAGDLPAGCAAAVLAAEAEARTARRGLWLDGEAHLSAEAPAAILEHVGRYVVVEGRVLGATERKTKAYLNFDEVWSEDFTVTVSKRTLNRLEASGMRWSTLKGRRVRVRGVVMDSGGPLIEASAPEDIERLD
ncbi:DNA-binding protein [Alsobacter sp. KACC 23698]|uniref:DNA-binding protein n=1 Tax=Alsobacter sp. KACC 23698 TaxID=3149229 RepID=A0AAU7JDI1_9HYPH